MNKKKHFLIRVDEELHRAAKKRADSLGLNLSGYVRRLVEWDIYKRKKKK